MAVSLFGIYSILLLTMSYSATLSFAAGLASREYIGILFVRFVLATRACHATRYVLTAVWTLDNNVWR